MKLFLIFCLIFLAATPVLLLKSNNEEDEVSAVTESDLEDEEDVEQPTEAVAETEDSPEEEVMSSTPKQMNGDGKNNKRKRPNKRPNRHRYNQLQRDKKRNKGKYERQRPANGKKGAAKRPYKSSAIQYEARSAYTDQLNKAVDDMLIHYTQSMSNDCSTCKLRVPSIPSWLQVQPWSYVAPKSTEGTDGTATLQIRQKRESELDEESDDDDAEDTTTVESIREEDDEDDDDEPDNSTDTKSATNQFQHTHKPWAIPQPDGSVEYNLQLVMEEGDQNRNATKEARTSRGRSRARHQQGGKLRYPRRPNGRIGGLELIERQGDVLVGSKENSTSRIFDIKVHIGPVKFVLKESADFPVAKVNVTSPILSARLRVVESDGQLVSARFKPTKIRPHDSVITIRLPSGQTSLPSESQLAAMVTHLSNEMARSWNSGYLLRRVKRQFKSLYVASTWTKATRRAEKAKQSNGNEEAKKLAQALLVPVNENPTTSKPVSVK